MTATTSSAPSTPERHEVSSEANTSVACNDLTPPSTPDSPYTERPVLSSGQIYDAQRDRYQRATGEPMPADPDNPLWTPRTRFDHDAVELHVSTQKSEARSLSWMFRRNYASSWWVACMQCAAAGLRCSATVSGKELALRCQRCERNGVPFCIRNTRDISKRDITKKRDVGEGRGLHKWRVVAGKVPERQDWPGQSYNAGDVDFVFCVDETATEEQIRETAEEILRGEERWFGGEWRTAGDIRSGVGLPVWHTNDYYEVRRDVELIVEEWPAFLLRKAEKQAVIRKENQLWRWREEARAKGIIR